MKRPRTARPFILSQIGCGWGLRHQSCSNVINGIDGEVKEFAHTLSRQPTMALVEIAIRTRTNILFPMVQRFQGDRVGKLF
ncbi:hypothetical protein NPIL_136161 [Nephila pilipes]|uniref:Uncharacterized protein n=1 Tax=Nephila pilipes TaxID=299642 RepID=A0A8X6QVT6_NEPPI|nr:hypothetical protein NPIL_136161 [Nephila pilipes]